MSVTESTVHVVDDDASFLAAISRLLRANGFAVKTYSSAREFLLRGDADVPGCVLADLQMPGMDGLELQSVLEQSGNPLPILFLTGHGDIPSTVRAMRGGAEDFLEKLAPKKKLLDAVKRALARDARERDARARQRELRARFDTLSVTGARSALSCCAGATQQANCRRSRHPRTDSEVTSHCDHHQITRPFRGGTHAANTGGGHLLIVQRGPSPKGSSQHYLSMLIVLIEFR